MCLRHYTLTRPAQLWYRLVGFEVDPFAAWMPQVVLDVALSDLCREAGVQLGSVVRVCDSLEQVPAGERFDLVVGNPPYGRVTLSPPMRRKFRRSLFGHANLYGLFTDLALRFTRPGGVIAYVTPTSFLAGEYFKALRGLLGREAPPASIGFVGKRKGVFADVLQETLLATYRRGGDPGSGTVHFISSGENGSIEVGAAGTFSLPESSDQPWLMPRTEAQGVLLSRVTVDIGSEGLVVRRTDGSLGPVRFPESEAALLASMTPENAHADLLAEPKGREIGPCGQALPG